jgi:hypothetical protein
MYQRDRETQVRPEKKENRKTDVAESTPIMNMCCRA